MRPSLKQALLSTQTSRQNKLALAIDNGVPWAWAGATRRSRLTFQCEPGGPFLVAKSYDEDIAPTLTFNDPRKQSAGQSAKT